MSVPARRQRRQWGWYRLISPVAVIALWGVFGLYFAVRGFSWEQSRT